MNYTVTLLALLVYGSASAQYHGGSNDGIAIQSVFLQNALPGIYTGGSNDGFAINTTLAQNALPGIYNGGSNDGFANLSITAQNPLPSIYLGGINDGFAIKDTAAQNKLTNIYFGGVNDGFATLQTLAQNTLPSIYHGSENDGFASISIITQNALPLIYHGGGNDGFATLSITHQNSSNPLPVEILAFAGAWFNDDAVLEWKTAVENKLDHFELERSEDGGRTFSYIASVQPGALSASEHDYRFTDVRAYYLPSDVLLYRLKCVNIGGDHKYSAVARLAKDRTVPVIVVYPNPTSGRFTLAILNTGDILGYGFQLLSTEGKIIDKGTITNINTPFDLSRNASGTYHLVLSRNGNRVQQFTILLTQ